MELSPMIRHSGYKLNGNQSNECLGTQAKKMNVLWHSGQKVEEEQKSNEC
jgi:hypothetical protein